MNPLVVELNWWLALGGILAQLAVLTIVGLLFLEKKQGVAGFLHALRHIALPLAGIQAIGASLLTLLYSEVFGFLPCGLCWLERVFLYPLALIIPVALWKKDRDISNYILTLAIPGLIISLYHHYLQMGGLEFVPCPATGISCTQRLMFEFGYITFPLLAATTFMTLIALAILARQR